MENRDGHDETTRYFIGKEIEHSAAYGMRTLFVVGVQPISDIMERYAQHDCEHIFLSANQSLRLDTPEQRDSWRDMLIGLLKLGVLVTIDVECKDVAWLNDIGANSYVNFIPMVNVRIPHVASFNRNTTIKIDDVGFAATNPGVWCHSLRDLMRHDVFTQWDEYTQDEIID